MELDKPQYMPTPSLSRDEMEEMQRRIAREAVFEDDFHFSRGLEGAAVAGIDQAFTDERAVSGVVVMEDGEVVERSQGVSELEIPYIPGLLAFREGPSIIDALESLTTEPELLMLDGSGRIHFRQAGIATHIGVIFDIPAVGVAKNLLCGEPRRGLETLKEGERVAIEADSSVGNAEGIIGHALQSRTFEGARKVNPLYVSPGHRVSNETAADLVEELCDGYKLPEPTRLADKYVEKVKETS
jgi:deoxyribonuclease V